MTRFYPRNWPQRRIVEEEAAKIRDGIAEEEQRQSASGNLLWVLDLFVSWKAKIQNHTDTRPCSLLYQGIQQS